MRVTTITLLSYLFFLKNTCCSNFTLAAAMAGGGLAVTARGGQQFEAKITPIVIISCIMAATGGLMFGYDVGVSG